MKPLADDDAVQAFHENLVRQKNLVQTKGDYIVIDDQPTPYEIPLAQCATYREILEWVTHLAEKNWFTVEILDLFACHAMAYVDDLNKRSGKPVD